NAAAYSAEQAASQDAFQQQQAELRRKLTEEKNSYWTGHAPAKNQEAKLSAPAAVVAARGGQQGEVISHGAQVDISRHLALGNVTVVAFYADWCGPCRQLSSSLEQISRTNPEIAVLKIDIVDWQAAEDRPYNIHSIPQYN